MSEAVNDQTKYEGVRVFMDGRDWIIPPLSVRQFREHYQTLLDVDITPDNWQEKIGGRLPIVLAAVRRNYPEVTEDQLLDMLDLKTFNVVLLAISNQSGMGKAKPGEE